MFGGIRSRGRMVGNAGTRSGRSRSCKSCLLVGWYNMHRPGCPGKLIDKSCPLWPGVSGIGAVVIGGDWSADFDRGSTAVPKDVVLTLMLTH